MKSICKLLAVMPLMLIGTLTTAQAPRPSHSGYDQTEGTTDPAIIAKYAEAIVLQRQGLSLRNLAKEAIKKGDWPGAFSLLQQSLDAEPMDSESRMLLTYFYFQRGQSDNVIAMLGPIVNPPGRVSYSVGNEINTQMLYTLALLDRNAWPEAVACYQKSRQNVRLRWFLNGGGPERSWPNPKFSADTPDFGGLRAYAHLILGTNAPHFMEEKDQVPFMLGHLQQLLQIKPKSFDAAFASGCLYRKLGRFADAQTAHAYASRLGSSSERKEINAELKELKADEDSHKRFLVQQAAKQAKLK